MPTFDEESDAAEAYLARAKATAAQGRPAPAKAAPLAEEGVPWFTVKDTVLSLPRAVNSFLGSSYNFVDRVLTTDALPNLPQESMFSPTARQNQPETVVGALAQPLLQFATGFVPIAGMATKAGGALSAGGRLTVTGDFVTGAAADVLAFEGNSGRLTDVAFAGIDKYVPGLREPAEALFGSMLTNKEDSEALGRVKNVLEGAGVGGMFGAMVHGYRAVAAGRRAKSEALLRGATEQAAAEEGLAAARKAQEGLQKLIEDGVKAGDTRWIAGHGDLADDLANLRGDPKWNGGGQTFNTDGTRYSFPTKTKVDIVTLASKEVPSHQLTQQVIRDFASQYANILKDPNVKIGVFWNEDKSVWAVDVNTVVDQKHRERSVTLAKRYGQTAVFDGFTMSSVPTGVGSDVSKSIPPDQAEKAVQRLTDVETPPMPAQAAAAEAPKPVMPIPDTSKQPGLEQVQGMLAENLQHEQKMAEQVLPQGQALGYADLLRKARQPGNPESAAAVEQLKAIWESLSPRKLRRLQSATPTGHPTEDLLKAAVAGEEFRTEASKVTAKDRNKGRRQGKQVAETAIVSTRFGWDPARLPDLPGGTVDEALPGLPTGTEESFLDLPAGTVEEPAAAGIGEGKFVRKDGKWVREGAPELPEGTVEAPGAAPKPSQEGMPQETPGSPQDAPAAGATQQSGAPEIVQGASAEEAVPTARPDKMSDLLKPLGFDKASIDRIRQSLRERPEKLEMLGEPNEQINPRERDPFERVVLALEENSLNFRHITLGDGPLGLARVIDELVREVTDNTPHPLMVAQQHEKMAKQAIEDLRILTGSSDGPEDFSRKLIASMGTAAKDLASVNRRIRANLYGFIVFTKNTYQNLTKVLASPAAASPEELAYALVQVEQFARGHSLMLGTMSEMGRAFGFLGHQRELPKVRYGAKRATEALRNIATPRGRDAAVKELARVYTIMKPTAGLDVTLRNAGAAAKYARGSLPGRVGRATMEFWMNALLWSPKTWALAASSNSVMSVLNAGTKAAGGAVGAVFSSGTERQLYTVAMREATLEMGFLVSGVQDSFKFALQAAKTGQSVLDAATRVVDTAKASERAAISAEAFDINNSLGAAATDWLGKAFRTPTTVLGAIDEMTRQMNYRAVAKARLYVEAADMNMRGAARDVYVADGIEDLVGQGQAYSFETVLERGREEARMLNKTGVQEIEDHADEFAAMEFDETFSALSNYAMQRAHDAAFSAPLHPAGIQRGYQDLVMKFPMLRLITPFVRTPAQLMNQAGRMFDVFSVGRYVAATSFEGRYGESLEALEKSRMRFLQDMTSTDHARKADAIGRLATGLGIGVTAMTMAANGVITGRGPADVERRKAMTDAGWLPYSYKLPNGDHVQLSRFDPVAMVFGVAADIWDTSRLAPGEDQHWVEQGFKGLLVGLANNLTNKLYLQGIATAIETLQSTEEEKVMKYVRNMAASFIPSGVRAATTAFGDDVMRDARTMQDTIMARVPGLSDNVRPQRNVLGEELHKVTAIGSKAIGAWMDMTVPIAYSTVSSDPIRKELANLGYGFQAPGRTKYGMDLTTIVNPKGKQDAYDRWGENTSTVTIAGKTLREELEKLIKSSRYKKMPSETPQENINPRVSAIKAVLAKYRDAAWRKTVKEYPELAEREREFLRNQRALKAGRDLRNFASNY